MWPQTADNIIKQQIEGAGNHWFAYSRVAFHWALGSVIRRHEQYPWHSFIKKLMTGKDFSGFAIPFKPVGLIFCDDEAFFHVKEGQRFKQAVQFTIKIIRGQLITDLNSQNSFQEKGNSSFVMCRPVSFVPNSRLSLSSCCNSGHVQLSRPGLHSVGGRGARKSV